MSIITVLEIDPDDTKENIEHSVALNKLHESTEVHWLRRCFPIIYQPKVDVNNGNHLIKIMYRFEQIEEKDTSDPKPRIDCKLCVIYAGESSYSRTKKHTHNDLATLFYRSFNRKEYLRTADINYMEFRNINLDPKAPKPWESIYTCDHGGKQTWSQGDRANYWTWFSLMHHYTETVPYEKWRIAPGGHRPIVYLNTCNHMWGEVDNNPEMEKHIWENYAVQTGDSHDAQLYSQMHVPTKCNFYSCCCWWRAKNGGGWCDRLTNRERSGGSFYVLHHEEDHLLKNSKQNNQTR